MESSHPYLFIHAFMSVFPLPHPGELTGLQTPQSHANQLCSLSLWPPYLCSASVTPPLLGRCEDLPSTSASSMLLSLTVYAEAKMHIRLCLSLLGFLGDFLYKVSGPAVFLRPQQYCPFL